VRGDPAFGEVRHECVAQWTEAFARIVLQGTAAVTRQHRPGELFHDVERKAFGGRQATCKGDDAGRRGDLQDLADGARLHPLGAAGEQLIDLHVVREYTPGLASTSGSRPRTGVGCGFSPTCVPPIRADSQGGTPIMLKWTVGTASAGLANRRAWDAHVFSLAIAACAEQCLAGEPFTPRNDLLPSIAGRRPARSAG